MGSKKTDKSPDNAKQQEPRVGVYVCQCGGNISDVVDCPAVAQEIATHPLVARSTDFIFMCSDPGQNMIIEDIHEHNLTHVIVAACSPNLHETTFRNAVKRAGMNQYLFEHVNIREQDSWVHSHHHDQATEKAIRLIEGGIAKVIRQPQLEPIPKKTVQRAVVVGGGVAGLTAAKELGRRGIPVDLIEKSPFLGGRVAQLDSIYASEENAQDLITALVSSVYKNDLITVHTQTEIISAEGSIGKFGLVAKTTARGVTQGIDNSEAAIKACPVDVPNEYDYGLTKRKAIYKPYNSCHPSLPAIDWENCTKCGECVKASNGISLDQDAEEIKLECGAIIMATGFNVYEPSKGEFAYGEDPFVVTLPQLIRHLAEHDDKKGEFVVNGKRIKTIGMIQCVGSRQVEGVHEGKDGNLNPYCSRVCCSAALHAAVSLTERFPDVQIYDFYRDVRTYWINEEYYELSAKNGAVFIRFPDAELPVVTIDAKSDHHGGGHIAVKAKDNLTHDLEITVPVDLLILAVGIEHGPVDGLVKMLSIPTDKDGFLLEGHPKLKPVESPTDGVFLAGTAQAPMDMTEATNAATAAAMKAASILSKDTLYLSPFIATVNPDKCNGSAKCIEQCEYGAITVGGTGGGASTTVDPSVCVGCGACIPVCPEKAITLIGYDLEQIEAQIEAMIKGGN